MGTPIKFGRQYFTDAQMQQESGGRQFDEAGKPLVGRYRDGTTPASGKEAYGAGQMQIGTAKATANRLGIPWDQAKFLNNRDYNLALANGHMQYLTQKYGDSTIAKAAYHSGEGTVDSAIKKYGRANFAQGLGPEGRAYIGADNVSQNTDIANVIDVATLRPGAGEIAQMNQGNTMTIADPFAVGDKIARQQATVESKGDRYSNAVDSVLAEVNRIQPIREENLRQVVETKSAINAEIKSETAALIERAKPFLAKRQAIRDQQNKIAGMNPLVAAVKGIFDPNYNPVDLRGEDYRAMQNLEGMAQDYDYITKLQSMMSARIDAEYANQDSMYQLQMENMDQDVALLQKSFGVANQVLGASMQGLENQMGLLRAQAQARNDWLSQATIGQVNEAIDMATNSPDGYATINGIKIGLGELRQTRKSYQDQEIGLASRTLALQNQQLGLANQIEDNIIEKMSPTQIEQAMQDNGMYQGQQLNVQKLTRAYATLKSGQELRAQEIANNSDVGVMKNNIGAMSNLVKGSSLRMQQMLGALPEEQRNFYGQVVTEIKAIDEGFKAAQAQGLGSQYMQQVYPRLQGLQQAQTKIVQEVAKRWSGGNKDLQAVGEAWLTGQPVSSESAIKGLISMSRSGLPAGTTLSGPAAKTFAMVKQYVAQQDAPQANQDAQSLLNPQDKASRDRKLISDIQKKIQNDYIARVSSEVDRVVPAIAAKVNINGKPHPFSQMDSGTYLNALASASDKTREMYKGKQASGGEIASAEMRNLLDILDTIQLPSGQKASVAFVDLMNRPEYQNQAYRVGENISRGQGFGDFVINSVGNSGLGESIRGYGDAIRNTYAERQRAVLSQKTKEAASMRGDPFMRSQMILSASDNLSKTEINQLMTAIRPMVKANARGNLVKSTVMGLGDALMPTNLPGGLVVPADTGANYDNAEFHQIGSIITTHKFDDPTLEGIRRKAAQSWQLHRGIIDRALNILN